VSIIRSGAVVETGTLTQLRHLTRTSINAEVDAVPAALRTAAGVHDLVVEGSRVRFDVDSADLDGTMRVLVNGGVRSLTATPPTLEELFLRHYGDRVAGGGVAIGDAAHPDGSGPHQQAALR